MQSDVNICSHCGATGVIGSKCEYCGFTIMPQKNIQVENRSQKLSWSDFRRDGYSLLNKKDQSDYCVVKDDSTNLLGLIDINGTFVFPCAYSKIELLPEHKICCVTLGEYHGVYDINKNAIIPLQGPNPRGQFLEQFNLLVGYNTVYDFKGNKLAELKVNTRISLLSPDYATQICFEQKILKKGLFRLKDGAEILSDKYVLGERISIDFFLISKYEYKSFRYGIYSLSKEKFLLDVIYSSVMSQ